MNCLKCNEWKRIAERAQMNTQEAFKACSRYENLGTPDEIKASLDCIPRLQQENEQLRELVRLAVEDMKHCICDTGCEACGNKNCKGFDDCEYEFTWQHTDKLKELGVEV